MTQEQFGEPKLNDPAAEYEAEIERVSMDMSEALNEEMPRVLNRSPGTKKLSSQEQFADYVSAIQDPAILQQRFQALIEGFMAEQQLAGAQPDPQIAATRAGLFLLEWEDSARKARRNGNG